jgi:hypothetical protein
MFEFDYEYIEGVYSQLITAKEVFATVLGIKILAAVLLLGHWYFKFFKSTDVKEGKEALKPPLTPYDIIKGVLMIVLIASYDQLLEFLDTILNAVTTQYTNIEPNIPKPDSEEIVGEDSLSWRAAMKQMADEIVRTLSDPTYPLLKLLEFLVWIGDMLIYGVFLVERFFFLGVLRVLGGIAIACSVLPKLEKWFMNWLGLYVAFYLLILPFFFINAFTNALYQHGETMINAISPFGATSPVLLILLIFILWVKWRLFKKSSQIVLKVFT